MTATTTSFDPAAWTTTTWLERLAAELSLRDVQRWKVEYPRSPFYITFGWLVAMGDMRIAVQRAGYGSQTLDRVKFQPCPPSYEDPLGLISLNKRHVAMPKAITVKFGRAPSQVADDIRRRLLPAYRDACTAFGASVIEACNALDRRRSTETQLKGALDALRPIEHTRSLVTFGDGPDFEFKASPGGDTVRIESRSCPADLAVEIAELVQRWNEAHR